MAETWAPPEAEHKDSWQPPESSSWTPPEASAPKVSPALMTLGKALGYVQDLGKEAFSGILPTEMMQTLFGGSESSLRPEERSKPLISPAASKEIIGQLPTWAGGETPFAQGAAESISGALSEFSKPSAITQIPTFLVPGVAETYAANVLSDLPKQYDKLRETIKIYGLASKETGAVAAESGIQDLMGFLALKGGAMARNVKPTLSETLFPTKPTPEEVITHAQEPNTAPNTVFAVESQPVIEAAKGEVQTRDKGNAPPQEIAPATSGAPIEQAPASEVLKPEPPVAAEVQPAEAAPLAESPGLRAINEEGGLQLNKGNEVSGFIVPNEKGYSLVGPDGILKPEAGEQFATAAEALNAATSRGMEIDPRVISEYGQSNVTPESRVPGEAAREGATSASQEPSVPVSPAAEEKARKFRGPADSFGSEVTPVAAHIINDIGGLMSKSTAKANGLYQKNPDLWDGAPALDHPTHNKVYGATGETPDVAAQSAYEEGLISEPTPDALYDAIKKESHTARTIQSEEQAQREEANRAVPDLKSTEEAVAHGESGTADIPALNAKRDQLLAQAEKATGDEKVRLITQAQLYREASETATKAAPASTETETQPQSPTGIRNAIVDKQRVDRGLPERMAPLRKTNPEAWDAAMTKIDENPNAGRELIGAIKNDQRALKPEESALLAHETVTRENAFDSAIEDVNNAKNPEDLAQAKQHLDLARNDIQELYDVGQRAGTESGQSLQARKMLVSQDYSLAKMEATKRAISNDGKPLNEKQLAEVKDLHDQLAALREKVEAADNAKSQEKQMAIYRQLVKESLTGTKEIAKQGGTLQAALDSAAAKARERIIARRGRLQVTVDPLNVAGLVDEAIIGASHIARGITKFSDWSTQMLRDFGERISPYLKDLWDRARQYHDAHAKLFEKSGDESGTPQVALAKISANAAEGKELNQKQVFDLARAHVNAGVEGLDNVIKQVTSDLQESHPGITEREVRDTFSGYGETKLPSKEADLAALRDYRRQAQLVSALEDAQKGEAPLKSGQQRDKPSERVRELQKQVAAAMREHGIETTDPEQELASRNKARETSLTNQIADLEKEIRTGEKPAQTGKVVPDSEAVKQLKARRDALKSKLQDIHDSDPANIAAEQKAKLESRQAAVQRNIDLIKSKLAGTAEAKKGADINRPAHPELEPLMQERDALREKLAESRKKPEAQKEEEAMQRRLEIINDTINARLAKLSLGDVSSNSPAQKVNRPLASPELEMAQQELDRVNALVADARKGPERPPDQVALQRYKTSLKNRTTDLEKKIAAGDYTKPSRAETQLDDEAMKAKAAYERVRQQFETGLEKDRQAKRPAWQKTLEQIAGTARASALSGYHTLAKLLNYDLAKLVEIPLTEMAGGLISKIPGMRGISAKANLESGSTIRPIVDFYVGATTKGMKEAWNVLRTGKTESKVLYGKPDYSPPKWYDFFGNLHMAEKAPLLTGTMKMYLRRATENAIKAGLDPSNEFTKAAINKAVYDHSQKAILQENNKFAEAVNGLQARMEAVNPKTGQVDVTNAVISTLVKTFLTKGIVRTPANYFAQTIARTPVGLATGLVKAGMAHYRGIGNLHPIEANAISALIKTGAVGSAFFILGAIDGTKEEKDRTFGGYWEPGRKRGGDDVPWGKIRIGGTTFPHLMTHNPLTESAQMGSTMMRVALSRFRKKDEDTQGIVKGAVKAIIGLAGKAPVASPVMRLGEDRANVVADLLKGLVPQLIQNLAEDIDSGVLRAPQTTVEEIKTAIPGLRETVPVKEEKPKGFSVRSRQ